MAPIMRGLTNRLMQAKVSSRLMQAKVTSRLMQAKVSSSRLLQANLLRGVKVGSRQQQAIDQNCKHGSRLQVDACFKCHWHAEVASLAHRGSDTG